MTNKKAALEAMPRWNNGTDLDRDAKQEIYTWFQNNYKTIRTALSNPFCGEANERRQVPYDALKALNSIPDSALGKDSYDLIYTAMGFPLVESPATVQEVEEAISHTQGYINQLNAMRCQIYPEYDKALEKNINALQTLIAAARKPAWMDISSAPRDGTEFLVYGGKLYGEVNDCIGYNTSCSKVSTTNGKYFSVTDTDTYACYIDKPTHWQPLPSPPPAGKGD